MRGWNLYDAPLVWVTGGFHNPYLRNWCALGSCLGPVSLLPRLYTAPINSEDYGPLAPVDRMALLGEMTIKMTLAHYDYELLRICWQETMGWDGIGLYGTLPPAGNPLGKGLPPGYVANNYLGLLLQGTNIFLGNWYFPSVYLMAPPYEETLGTERSLARVEWRAVPYTYPVLISGAVNESLPMSGAPYEISSSGACLFQIVF